SATGFFNLYAYHMLIKQFFHLFGVFVVINPLTGILLHQLAQAGELLNRFFVVATILVAKTLVFKEGGGLQRYLQAAGEGCQGFVEVFTYLEVCVNQLTISLFNLWYQYLTQLLNVVLVFHAIEYRP